jgi:hypothetical protein
MQPPQQPEQTPEQAIAETMSELALEIYARLASDHIRRFARPIDPQILRDLAQSAQQAALAYFHQLGVQFEGDSTNEQS